MLARPLQQPEPVSQLETLTNKKAAHQVKVERLGFGRNCRKHLMVPPVNPFPLLPP